MEVADALLDTAIFRDVRRADVQALLPDVRERTFARGESVWVEGDPATAL